MARYDYKIIFLDVGQGDATLIRKIATGDSVLIDAKIAGPVLAAIESPEQLQAIFVTHWDADHIGGLPDIIRRFQKIDGNVVSIFINKKIPDTRVAERFRKTLVEAIKDGNVEIKEASRPHEAKIIDGEFRILWPPHYAFLMKKMKNDPNYTSLILRFEVGLFTLLIGGDAEGDAWKDKDIEPQLFQADVLRYPHHGGRMKKISADELIKKINPDRIVVSVGKNAYGHPSKEFINAKAKFSEIEFLSTEHGSITLAVCSSTGKSCESQL